MGGGPNNVGQTPELGGATNGGGVPNAVGRVLNRGGLPNGGGGAIMGQTPKLSMVPNRGGGFLNGGGGGLPKLDGVPQWRQGGPIMGQTQNWGGSPIGWGGSSMGGGSPNRMEFPNGGGGP